MSISRPEILSPAGDKESFFAAMDAGADAIYLGLKEFSARAKATNFHMEEVAILKDFACSKGVKVYVAMNVMVRELEINKICGYLKELLTHVRPHALIIQDLGLVRLIRNMEFNTEIHLSTLGNFSIGSGFNVIKSLGIKRVVLPRELTIDEIKYLAQQSKDIGLEIFVHGALCYGVSGRCYWSSMLGGKSGLRGMCVQPCRRSYTFNQERGNFFSCRDLGLDVLTKIVLMVPQVVSWKIEGRKKSPHYVYYVTKAYRVLRDSPSDNDAKKMAQDLINMSLGRPTTHYFFLSHRRYCPIQEEEESASGLFISKLGYGGGKKYIRPRIDLYPGDRIRISYEGHKGHNIIKINRFVKKGGKYLLENNHGVAGDPVFLIDRKEPQLVDRIKALKTKWLEFKKNKKRSTYQDNIKGFVLHTDIRNKGSIRSTKKQLSIYINPYLVKAQKRKKGQIFGVWMYDPDIDISNLSKDSWIFIDPVIWPEDETRWKKAIRKAIKKGYRSFILNSILHLGLLDLVDLKELNLWLGPFANIANTQSIYMAKSMGFMGVILSPELGKKDYMELARTSPLPLGIFIRGIWPYTISRTIHPKLDTHTKLLSPKKEGLWIKKLGFNYYLFPDWLVDLRGETGVLKKAGFDLFLELIISVPHNIKIQKRKYLFNWNNI